MGKQADEKKRGIQNVKQTDSNISPKRREIETTNTSER
jgi:hypothetical protein